MRSIAADPKTAPNSSCTQHDSRPSGGEPAGAVAHSSRRWTGPPIRLTYSTISTCSARPTSTSMNRSPGAAMKSDSPHRSSVTRAPTPATVDRETFEAGIDALRTREKEHIRQGDAIAAARRAMPMVEVDADLELTGPDGPVTLLDAFEGRRQLLAYYFMWNTGKPAPDQCEGCTWVTTQVQELGYL